MIFPCCHGLHPTYDGLLLVFHLALQATGDIFSITVPGVGDDDDVYMLNSFHGDTNGLATIPVTTAVHNTKSSHFADHVLIFGLDANTYEHAKPGKTQDVRFQGCKILAGPFEVTRKSVLPNNLNKFAGSRVCCCLR